MNGDRVDLRPTDEQQQLRASLRRLFDRRMGELVAALPEPPRQDAARDLADATAVGLPGLGLPEELGGAGAFSDLVVAHEELGRGLAGPLLSATAAAGRLLVHATGDARSELVGALAAGRSTATVGVADGNGRCRRVICGPDVADLLVIDDVTVFVVPGAGIAGAWREEPTGCDIPSWACDVDTSAATHRLTVEPPGLSAFRTETTVLAAARQLGGARAVLDRTIEHVKTREQFDRPIGTFQAVQHQLADIATDVDATDLAVAQAAWAVDAAGSPGEVERLACIAGLTAAATLRRATLVAHQLHGGMGFVLDSPLHLWSARAIADPTVPRGRRELLDALATASGITADDIAVPPDHRVTQG